MKNQALRFILVLDVPYETMKAEGLNVFDLERRFEGWQETVRHELPEGATVRAPARWSWRHLARKSHHGPATSH